MNSYFNGLIIGAILSLMAIILSSCDDSIIDNTDRNYPIDLSIEQEENGPIKLTWTPTRVSTFEKYIIVRSAEPLSDSIVPNALTSIVEIEDIELTTFEDFGFPFSDQIFYKVFADVGDHFAFSETKSLSPDIVSFEGQYAASVLDAESNQIFILNRSNEVIVYNYITEEKRSFFVNFNPNKIKLIRRGDDLDVYLFGINNFRYSIYNGVTFLHNKSVFLDQSISDMVLSKNGLNYVSNRSTTQNLYVIDQVTQDILHKHTLRESGDFSTLGFFDQAQNILVEASRREINLYQMSPSGNVLSRIEKEINFRSNVDMPVTSPDGKYIFPYRDLNYFDRELNEVNTQENRFVQNIVFPNSNDRLLVNAGDGILEFDFPGFNLLRSIKLVSVPINIFYDEGILITVQSFFPGNEEPRIILQTIEI